MELWNLLGELETLQLLIVAVFGLFVGSLLNVFNYRIPHMEMYNKALFVKDNSKEVSEEVKEILSKYKNFNMFFPASACPQCNHKIKWYENIPVISYLFLKGKCSSCKIKISIEYPFVELLNSVLWIYAYFIFGWTFELFFILAMISIVISESFIDLKFEILPTTGLVILFFISLFLSIDEMSNISIYEAAIVPFFVYFIILGFVNFWEKLRGFEEDMFGRGDILYLAVISSWVGFLGLLSVISYACLFGILIYIFIKLSKKENIKNKIIPFGPSISIGFITLYLGILPNFIEILLNN